MVVQFLAILFLMVTVARADDAMGSVDSSKPPTAAAPEIAHPTAVDDALWEIGAVGGDVYVPDYPAAGQKHAKWIAAPYGIYRGSIFRADRQGARARLVQGRWVDIEMSFSASFASHSKDNMARAGMPDLDYLLEFGPRLSVLLSRLNDYGSLRFFVPVRAVYSSNLSNFKLRGFTYTPALYAQVEPFWHRGWIGLCQLTSRFGSRQLTAYYYDVAPEYALPQRPIYEARAGYLGTDLFTGVAIPIGTRWRFFGGGQLYFDDGSANRASPLFKRTFDYSVGAGLSYAIFRSSRPAQN